MRSHVDRRPQNGTWHEARGSPQTPACASLADPGSLLSACLRGCHRGQLCPQMFLEVASPSGGSRPQGSDSCPLVNRLVAYFSEFSCRTSELCKTRLSLRRSPEAPLWLPPSPALVTAGSTKGARSSGCGLAVLPAASPSGPLGTPADSQQPHRAGRVGRMAPRRPGHARWSEQASGQPSRDLCNFSLEH